MDAGDQIVFSTKGGEPFIPYTGPITLEQTTTLRAYAVRDGRKSTLIESSFLKRSHDWTIELQHPYANQYAASGPQALIDGLAGNSDWHTGGWQGFLGQDLIATIDLRQAMEVLCVRGRFLQEQRSWIWMPTEVVVDVSDDGAIWRRIGGVSHAVDPKANDTPIAWLGIRTSVRARYVRVHAKSVGTCPDWHPGAGNPCWIFADEIEIDAC